MGGKKLAPLRHEHDRRPPERDLLPGRVEHRDLAVVSAGRDAVERQAEPQRHRLRSARPGRR